MHLRNNFVDYAWATFMDGWCCWYCEMNTADALHHIFGRGPLDSKLETSIFNAAPICNNKCHLPNHGKIMTNDWQKIFCQKTFDYLVNQGIEFTDTDREFILKYKEFYRRDQVSLAGKSKHKQSVQRDALDEEKRLEEPVPPVHAPIQKKTKVRRK